MKKNYIFALLFLAFMPFVSAQYFGGFWYGTEQVIDSVVQNLEPFFRAILGGYDWSGYLLFEKVLLFVLISIVVGLILGKLPVFDSLKNKKILRLVAVIIGILAVRNLNYIWIGTILVQYEVLFIAIAGILPFMIYWTFTKDIQTPALKKVAWIFYAVIYFGLWITSDLQTYNAVYLWGAIVGLAYGLFLDTYVTQWLRAQEMKKQFSRHTWNQIAEINERISKLNSQIADGTHPNPRSAQQEIADLMRHRQQLAGRRNII